MLPMCPITQISQPKIKIQLEFLSKRSYSIFLAKPNIESKNDEPIVMKAIITENATKGWNWNSWTGSESYCKLTWILNPVSGKRRSNIIVITCPLSREYCRVLFLKQAGVEPEPGSR